MFATQWAYHADGFDVRYIGGGTNYHYTLTSDQDGATVQSFQLPLRPVFLSPAATPCVVVPGCAPLTINPRYISVYQEAKHWFSHEINIASTDDGDFQWLAGGYYYHEAYKQPVYTYQPDQAQLGAPLGAALNPNRRIYDDRPQLSDRSYAAFGQVDWQFAPTLKTTLGLRYSHDHKYGSEAARIICFPPSACLGGATPEGLGTFTPAVDVTSALAFRGAQPQGVSSPVTFDTLGFGHRNYDASWEAVTGTAGLQ